MNAVQYSMFNVYFWKYILILKGMQEYVLKFCHRHEREKLGVPNT